jgi:hypothetical protein
MTFQMSHDQSSPVLVIFLSGFSVCQLLSSFVLLSFSYSLAFEKLAQTVKIANPLVTSTDWGAWKAWYNGLYLRRYKDEEGRGLTLTRSRERKEN